MALVAFLFALPSLAIGLACEDSALAERVQHVGPLSAYAFTPPDHDAARELIVAERTTGIAPWWVGEQLRASFFRPLTSLSLWLDFAHGAPPWWMHLENCAIYALTIWLAVLLYRRLGLSGAGLGWAAVFLGLDGAFAASVGWIAARNTLLAGLFGLACLVFHDRARREGRPLLLALASLCFALSLLSGELGLCTLGYVFAYAITVDRDPPLRRAAALAPYAALTCVYLVHYATHGYGTHDVGAYRDPFGAPVSTALAWVESAPLWLASAATLPFAGFQPMLPHLRVQFLVVAIVILAVLVPLIRTHWKEQPAGSFFALGALLSLVPLASVAPMERIRFFLALGVCGVLGPWVARDFDAPERPRRWVARSVWFMHGVWLPLLFVPFMFSVHGVDSAATALDAALPHASSPIAIALNPPMYAATEWVTAMRAHRGEESPPVVGLYAGVQPVEVERPDDRTLELHVAGSWCPTAMERVRNFSTEPFHVGDRVELEHLVVEVREVDAGGVPTRARFTFERSLDDPELSFWSWEGKELAPWTPPPPGGRAALPPASLF